MQPYEDNRRPSMVESPGILSTEFAVLQQIMEWEYQATGNRSLGLSLVYIAAVSAMQLHASTLPNASSQPLQRYYLKNFIGNPDATEPQEELDLLQIGLTASHIAEDWQANHTSPRAARIYDDPLGSTVSDHAAFIEEVVATTISFDFLGDPKFVEKYLQRAKDEYLKRKTEEAFPTALFTIPPLLPRILQTITDMGQNQDPRAIKDLAKQATINAILDGEITEEDGKLYLKESWDVELEPLETLSPEISLKLIREFASRARSTT